MSKLLPTLFLVLVIALIGGVAVLSFMEVPAPQEKIENTVTLEQFEANKPS